MVNLGHIALDGTKLKASGSNYKAMSYGRMKQEVLWFNKTDTSRRVK
jgi:hypothetical protein